MCLGQDSAPCTVCVIDGKCDRESLTNCLRTENRIEGATRLREYPIRNPYAHYHGECKYAVYYIGTWIFKIIIITTFGRD